MAKTNKKSAILEQFAIACTEAAQNRAKRKLDWELSTGSEPGKFAYFHCPLPGDAHPHQWTGAPRARAWIDSNGEVQCACDKCLGAREDYDPGEYAKLREGYTDQVKRTIRWEHDGVVKASFKTTILRSHVYFDRDRKFAIRRDKIFYPDGRRERANKNPWDWRVAPLNPDGTVGRFLSPTELSIADWQHEHYPEMEHTYETLWWYQIEYIDQLEPDYRVVITEGEKDADTFNSLMRISGIKNLFATCLASNKPRHLASHHKELIEQHHVVIIGDIDEPGRQMAEHWTRLVYHIAKTTKLIYEQLELSGEPGDNDLTDWVEKRGGTGDDATARQITDELLKLIDQTPPLADAIGRVDEWRQNMITSQRGVTKADSPHNCEKVWTQHPDLRGRVHFNIRTGEVEVSGPPWGGIMTVGARTAAAACSAWLERKERMSLSIKTLQEMLDLDHVAPPYDPVADKLDVKWDGEFRIEKLWTHYIPLNIEPGAALNLAYTFMADLAHKMRGDLVPQKVLMGIGTESYYDFADAFAGAGNGAHHQGKLAERQVEQYTWQGSIVVQTSMETVSNRQSALLSLPNIFSGHVNSKRQSRIPSPMFLAVGAMPGDARTEATISERVYTYALKAPPLMDALRADAPQLIAEAAYRIESLSSAQLPDKSKTLTLDAKLALDRRAHMLHCLYLYATREVDHVDLANRFAVAKMAHRNEPLKHIARKRFIDVMKPMLLQEHRDISSCETAFNAICRTLNWPKKVRLNEEQAEFVGVSLEGLKSAVVLGTYMRPERLEQLKNLLFQVDDPWDGGGNSSFEGGIAGEEEGGNANFEGGTSDADFSNINEDSTSANFEGVNPLSNDDCFQCSDLFSPDREHNLDQGNPSLEDSCSHVPGSANTIGGNFEKSRLYHLSRTSHVYKKEEEGQFLEGGPAIEKIKNILSTPGVAAIDFETYPTDPKWHGEQAKAKAAWGRKKIEADAEILKARLGIRAEQRQACVLSVAHEDGRVEVARLTPLARELVDMFAGHQVTLTSFNAQFETEVLVKHGIRATVECSMLAAKALYLQAVGEDEPQPVEFSLAALLEKEFGRTRDKGVRNRDWRLLESLDAEAVEYCRRDATDALALWQLYEKRLRDEQLWDGYVVMARSILATAEINTHGGLKLDREAHAALMSEMETTVAETEKVLDRLSSGLIENHGSDAQVSDWIGQEILGESPASLGKAFPARLAWRLNSITAGRVKGWKLTKTGKLSLRKGTARRKAEQLREIYRDVAEYLVARERWRKAKKLLESFGPSLLQWQEQSGYIRGQLKVFGAWTGRQSCRDPNLQNQPHDPAFRACWVAAPGRKLVIADYSQIELRLLAIETNDERLKAVYREGRDVHQETADIAGIPRKNAKNVNFAMAYGSGAAGLAENFGFTLDEASAVMNRVMGAYPGLADFRRNAPAKALEAGYIAIRPSRRVAYDDSSPGTTAINAPIQGGAASVQMRALTLVDQAIQDQPWLDVQLAASVHDELILDAAEEDAEAAAELLVAGMSQALTELYPEAEDMGLARLTAAGVVDSWAQKP